MGDIKHFYVHSSRAEPFVCAFDGFYLASFPRLAPSNRPSASMAYGISTTRPFWTQSSRSQPRHRYVWGPRRVFSSLGQQRRKGSHSPRGYLLGSRNQFFRHCGRLFQWRIRGNPGQGDHWPPQCCLISTKATFAMGDGPNDLGSSRYHLIQACEASLRRLNTDYIDVYHLHGFDAQTPVDETLKTLDTLVESGKCATSPVPIFRDGI